SGPPRQWLLRADLPGSAVRHPRLRRRPSGPGVGARAAAYAGACDGGHAARRGPRGLSRRRRADPGTRRLPVPRPARTRTRRSRVPPAARWRDGTEVDHRLRGTRAAPLRDRLRLLLIAPSARLGDVELRRVLDGG